jgi:hypothetical protein
VELEENRRVLAKNLDAVRKMTVDLDADMALLRAAQTSPAPIVSKLVYTLGNILLAERRDVAGGKAERVARSHATR